MRMEQRSKFIGAPSRNEFWEPQEGDQSKSFISLKKQNILKIEAWRSLVARLLWEQDAAGSSPVAPTILCTVPPLGGAVHQT